MQLTKNFHLSEFACKDGTPVPKHLIPNVMKLAELLQKVRDTFGDYPVIINSAYRHPEYNAAIGGSPRSQHLEAKAADIKIDGVRPDEVYQRISDLHRNGEIHAGGLGRYNTFTHVDIRPGEARWDNRNK